MLLCPVRDCQKPLVREQRRLHCVSGHSFDVARSGYVNLLQPQDKKSKDPGDSAAAVAARRRLHDLGITAPLRAAISELLQIKSTDEVLDVGCGDGFYLGNLECKAHGVDISIPAIDAASKRYPACEWIVANADRGLPYSDSSFSTVISITARMNSSEFRRVLQQDGKLLVAIPAPDDLIELRGAGRERVGRTIEAFAAGFEVISTSRASTTADLDAPSVEDVLLAIYRPMQAQPAVASRVTFSFDLILMKPRGAMIKT